MHDARPVFLGKHIRAIHYGPTDRFCVFFDHGRRDRTGFPEDKPSGKLRKQGIGTLSISLSEHGWFLTPENAALRAALDAHCAPARDIRALGYSMGAYGAVLFSKALHLRMALLFSPQYSVFAARAPWDKTRNLRAAGLDAARDDLETEAKPDLQGAVLFDPRNRTDMLHARAMERLLPGLRAVAVPFGGHPANRNLVLPGRSGNIPSRLFGDEDPAIWMQRFRRAERSHSDAYQKGISAYLGLRRRRDHKG